jgi:hypothetical protein
MIELAAATAALTGLFILFRSRQSLQAQRDILLTDFVDLVKVNKQLGRIVAVHGCAPDDDLRPAGTLHECTDCASTWEAQEFQVEWLDDGLKNRITQSWRLAEQGKMT